MIADAKLAARWQKAASSLDHELATSGVDCSGATISVEAERDRVDVTITASDGRRAHRTATTPHELAAVVAGVIASVPSEPAPAALEAEAPADAPTPASEPTPAAMSADRRAIFVPTPERALPKDPASSPATLGATFGTRVGFPTGVVSTEIELRGDIRFERWIVALSGRSAPSGTRVLGGKSSSEWEYVEFSVGALGGRWFALGSGFLTTTIGPRAGIVTRETDAGTSSRRDIWLQAAARYVVPLGERWRPALSLELEGAPARLFAVADPSPAGFPSWSASLRFGIVGSVP